MENDRIVVWFDPKLGQAIRELLLESPRLVLDSGRNEQDRGLVRREITLNRPDTLDEGEINFYQEEEYLLFARLVALGASASFHVAEFEPPEGVR